MSGETGRPDRQRSGNAPIWRRRPRGAPTGATAPAPRQGKSPPRGRPATSANSGPKIPLIGPAAAARTVSRLFSKSSADNNNGISSSKCSPDERSDIRGRSETLSRMSLRSSGLLFIPEPRARAPASSRLSRRLPVSFRAFLLGHIPVWRPPYGSARSLWDLCWLRFSLQNWSPRSGLRLTMIDDADRGALSPSRLVGSICADFEGCLGRRASEHLDACATFARGQARLSRDCTSVRSDAREMLGFVEPDRDVVARGAPVARQT